jgi:hypothetical protein
MKMLKSGKAGKGKEGKRKGVGKSPSLSLSYFFTSD